MPVIGISISRLRQLVRSEISDEKLTELLDQLGCDVDGVTSMLRYKSRASDYVIEVLPSESLPLTDQASGRTVEKAEDLWEKIGEETVVRLDLLPVRPDIFDAGGLARALRGYLGVQTGLAQYSFAQPGPEGRWRVEVDPRMADPLYRRPFIQCAIVRNVTLDDSGLRAVMKLQENLHWALCRDRKFASLGAYDLSKLQSPIRYTLVDREDFSFTPLFWGWRGPVSPAQMLKEHPKGMAYAHLVEGLSEVPALIAANDVVLSLPPVINAEESKVTTATRDIFLDVTGHNLPVVTRALSLLATAIVEMDLAGQAQIEQVEIVQHVGASLDSPSPVGGSTQEAGQDPPLQSLLTPELATETYSLRPEYAARLLGLELSRERCVELLRNMRHEVHDPEGANGSFPSVHGGHRDPLLVTVAAYRNDIMHEVDLVEDIAVAYGYHHIVPSLVPSFTAGEGLALNNLSRKAASVMTGLQFTEVLSLVLTSENEHYARLRREESLQRVTLANPISVEQTMMREHLYASLLGVLALNMDQPLPQRIFEVGDVVKYGSDLSAPPTAASVGASLDSPTNAVTQDGESRPATTHDPRPTELRVLGAAICHGRAGYSEGRGVLDSLLYELGYLVGAESVSARTEEGPIHGRPLQVEYRADDNPTALRGRAAAVYQGQRRIAELFEVHPETLLRFGLSTPVVLLSVLLGENG
ncbi:hypothetical protein IT575_04790 [bacterium]|nr:hypothetical protein [bacterium]